jgi:hypothetical protein
MDRCEEDVNIACGHYLLVEEEKRKKRKYWIDKVFRAREKEGEFHTLFGHLKDDRQILFKYFRISFLKFENLKQLLYSCCTVVVQLLYSCCTVVVQLLHSCCTAVIQLLYSCCTVVEHRH